MPAGAGRGTAGSRTAGRRVGELEHALAGGEDPRQLGVRRPGRAATPLERREREQRGACHHEHPVERAGVHRGDRGRQHPAVVAPAISTVSASPEPGDAGVAPGERRANSRSRARTRATRSSSRPYAASSAPPCKQLDELGGQPGALGRLPASGPSGERSDERGDARAGEQQAGGEDRRRRGEERVATPTTISVAPSATSGGSSPRT